MEIIPASIHLWALSFLAIFAVFRSSAFPLALVVMYTAFFCIIREAQTLEFIEQLVIAATLTGALSTITMTIGRNVKHSAWFCLAMLCGILNLLLMFSMSGFSGMPYFIAQLATATFTYCLHIAEFLIMAGMINGTRHDRIIEKCGRWFVDSLSVFKPSARTLPAYIWQGER